MGRDLCAVVTRQKVTSYLLRGLRQWTVMHSFMHNFIRRWAFAPRCNKFVLIDNRSQQKHDSCPQTLVETQCTAVAAMTNWIAIDWSHNESECLCYRARSAQFLWTESCLHRRILVGHGSYEQFLSFQPTVTHVQNCWGYSCQFENCYDYLRKLGGLLSPTAPQALCNTV